MKFRHDRMRQLAGHEEQRTRKAVLAEMPSNELYLAVLPLIHLSDIAFGRTEQALTLFPDRNFATEFSQDEVEGYILTFKNRINLLTGGHVTGYEIHPEKTDEGRVIVRVIQNVS